MIGPETTTKLEYDHTNIILLTYRNSTNLSNCQVSTFNRHTSQQRE